MREPAGSVHRSSAGRLYEIHQPRTILAEGGSVVSQGAGESLERRRPGLDTGKAPRGDAGDSWYRAKK